MKTKISIGLAVMLYLTISNHVSFIQKHSNESEPNYKVAVEFINDYVGFLDNMKNDMGIVEWVNMRRDVTEEFKIELARIIDEAKTKDPEIGLGFDPIINAQDFPNQFIIDKTDSDYLIVKGIDWTEYQLTLKLRCIENIWLVDGSGIVNIPENKRTYK